MRFPALFTILIILTISDVSAQDSLIINSRSNPSVTNDTSVVGNSTSNSKMYKQDEVFDDKGEYLTSVSHEQNDRKKKALVRIGIGIVFLVVVIGGWRRRRLAK